MYEKLNEPKVYYKDEAWSTNLGLGFKILDFFGTQKNINTFVKVNKSSMRIHILLVVVKFFNKQLVT